MNLPTGAMVHVSEGTNESNTDEWFLLRRLLHAAEQANWQRGGGQGARPEIVPTPQEAYQAARSKASASGRRNLAKERQIARAKAAKQQRAALIKQREGRSADGN